MRVSWLATEGTWTEDRTGRDEADAATSTENTWTAPAAAARATLFVVLRDTRGGVDFTSLDVHVP